MGGDVGGLAGGLGGGDDGGLSEGEACGFVGEACEFAGGEACEFAGGEACGLGEDRGLGRTTCNDGSVRHWSRVSACVVS